ncbi:MAG: PaaI family thioesterase [Sphingomonadaceae bacterium]|nr:PaaI family thioesterase [Sphingomonadaceae bacterium]
MSNRLAALKEDGWRVLRTSGYSTSIGEMLFRTDGGELVVGFLAEGDIVNETVETVHGGAMMTFADTVFGFAASRAARTHRCVTVQLQYQFSGVARLGEFVSCAPEVVRATSQLVFLRGLILSNGRNVGAVDAMFKILDPEKYEGIKAG